jgi:hypothetical protein
VPGGGAAMVAQRGGEASGGGGASDWRKRMAPAGSCEPCRRWWAGWQSGLRRLALSASRECTFIIGRWISQRAPVQVAR